MKINNILDVGKPSYNFDDDMAETTVNRRNLTENIQRLGAGHALEQILNDPSKRLYRGIRQQSATVFTQNTWESTRMAANTANYVTLLTEILPSWKSHYPRSKIVACSSSINKANKYGRLYMVLPTTNSACTYVQSHDFWSAFDGINHIYNSEFGIPAVVEGIQGYIKDVIQETGVTGLDLLAYMRNPATLEKALRKLEQDLDAGTIKVESLNPELRALFESDNTHDLLAILDNLLDPSFMPVTKGGELRVPGNFEQIGEEVAVGGQIVYVAADLFNEVFGLK